MPIFDSDVVANTNVRVSGTIESGDWFKTRCRLCTAGTAFVSPTSSAPSVVDGVTVAVGDRILVTNLGVLNGIYTVVTVGSGSNGVWTRSNDMATSASAIGAMTAVTSGTTYGGSQWATNWKTGDTLGSTDFVWNLANVDSPFWVGMNLTNGWLHYDSSIAAPSGSGRNCRYRKKYGIVFLSGVLKSGSGVAFSLPAGFRPISPYDVTVPVVVAGGTGTLTVQHTTGAITIAGTNATGWTYIEGVSFVSQA